jgi:tol-pal system protein YbgF
MTMPETAKAPPCGARRPRPAIRRGAAWPLSIVLLTAATGAAEAQAPVQDLRSVEQRLQRIERLVDSSGMVQLLESVKALQQEVRELRGELEVQNHSLNQIKQRQRELYTDLDRRLQALERSRPAAPAVPPPAAAGPSAPAPAQAPPAPSTPAPAPAAPPASTPSAPSAIDPVAEQQAYQGAFTLLKDGRYEQAAQAFQTFLGEHQGGRYADNAQYWLGETYYGMRRFDEATREFHTLLRQYPESQKRPHAMLKLGYSQAELGRAAEAEATLKELVRSYPQSTAAGLARKRLQRLGDG